MDNFESVLHALITPNNDERRQAEQVLEEAKNQPDTLISCLIQVCNVVCSFELSCAMNAEGA